MASRALNRVEVESFERFNLIGDFTGPLAEASQCDPVFTGEADGYYILSRKALGGAKAVMMAIGLEVVTVLCIIGIWQLLRLFW